MPEKSATKVMTQQENAPRQNGGVKPGRPFAKGNAGRPPGSKNRKTAVAQALLAGEETELVRKAIELAKAGDVQMLTFAERAVDQDRPPATRFFRRSNRRNGSSQPRDRRGTDHPE